MTIQPKQIQACHGILPREKILAFHLIIHHLNIGRYAMELGRYILDSFISILYRQVRT